MKVQSYALEQRIKQLRNETEQLKKENARLSELDAKLNAILSNSGTSSTLRTQCQANPRCDLAAGGIRRNGVNFLAGRL